MKRAIALVCLAPFFGMIRAEAKEAPKPHPAISCSPDDKQEEEASKEVRYFVDGREHIEYCFMGKKHTIVDSGDNG